VDPREASLATLLLRLDPIRVSHIYNVGDKIDTSCPEYVNQSYFCMPSLAQQGIVTIKVTVIPTATTPIVSQMSMRSRILI